MEQKFKVDKIMSMRFLDLDGNPLGDEKVFNPIPEEFDLDGAEVKAYSPNQDYLVYPKEEDKIIAQGRNYKITQKYSEYTDGNGITMVYPSIAKNILNKDKGE